MIFNKMKAFLYRSLGLLRRYRSKNISKKSYLANDVQIHGLKNITIGQNTTIGQRTTITINNRSDFEHRLLIGNNVYIGRDNFFSIGGKTIIKDYCLFGNNCAIISSNHSFDNPLIPYGVSGFTEEDYITIGVNCWFGINVSVIGNVSIGHGSIVGANSLVTKDIPPFSIAIGNPAKVIKRYDFLMKKWKPGSEITSSEFLNEDY